MSALKIKRRTFLGGMAATGLCLSTGSAVSQDVSAKPVRGGHIRAGLADGSTTNNLNPTTFDDTFMVIVSNSFRDHLVDIGPTNELVAGLAESWEPSPDAASWRFKLRQGVTFSDGKPLTTDDVIASINAHRGDDTKSAARSLFVAVKDIRSDGKDTVVFELEGGNSDFPYLLTDYHAPIVPSKDGKADLLSPVGTGLYMLESFEPGIRTMLKRNPNAWQASELGFVDEATLLMIADSTARQIALLGGQVDVISRPDFKTIHLLSGKPGIRIAAVPTNTHYSMPMQADVAPFDNIDVRTALRYAIDRKEFIDRVLHGFGTIGNDTPIGPGFKYHDASIEQAAYDPDRARHHLKRAGLDRLDIDYHTAEVVYDGAVDAGVLFHESAAKAGININVRREPDDGYWSSIAFKKPFYASFWGSRPVEDMILSLGYLSDAPWNESHIRNERLDQLIKAARAELDDGKRKQIYGDVQDIIASEARVIIPAFAQTVMAMNERVGTTGKYGADREMDGGHFVKRWWMNA